MIAPTLTALVPLSPHPMMRSLPLSFLVARGRGKRASSSILPRLPSPTTMVARPLSSLVVSCSVVALLPTRRPPVRAAPAGDPSVSDFFHVSPSTPNQRLFDVSSSRSKSATWSPHHEKFNETHVIAHPLHTYRIDPYPTTCTRTTPFFPLISLLSSFSFRTLLAEPNV